MSDEPSNRSGGPVSIADWARDLDIFEPSFVVDPSPVFRMLRDACPVALTERRGRTWMPVGYDDIGRIADDTAHFSSRRVGVVDAPERRPLKAPPITSDPPDHGWSRRILLPAFSPRRIEGTRPVTQSIAWELLDEIADRGRADGAADYARHIPVRVIAHMLGVPSSDEEIFTGWAVHILQEGFLDPDGSAEAIHQILDYFGAKVDQRSTRDPDQRPDDLITLLMETEVDGEPLDRHHILGTCFLLLLAGIDTTWSAIGSSLLHLATHPDDQRRLRDEPELVGPAIEELLRFYSPVTMAREVVEDVEFAGCPMRAGDKVLLTFPAANRDPAHFEAPDDFVIDRERNRHVAFGKGIHRCLGSNLARMELEVAIGEWLDRIPTFTLEDPGAVTWSGGQVRGPRTIPLRW